MTVKVLVSEASLNTVSVELQTIRVSGKQMTLSVFRQLIDEFPERADNPILWGSVNYHPDRCGDESPHTHVIWQKGTELRRCRIYEATPAYKLMVDDGWKLLAEESLRSGDVEKAIKCLSWDSEEVVVLPGFDFALGLFCKGRDLKGFVKRLHLLPEYITADEQKAIDREKVQIEQLKSDLKKEIANPTPIKPNTGRFAQLMPPAGPKSVEIQERINEITQDLEQLRAEIDERIANAPAELEKILRELDELKKMARDVDENERWRNELRAALKDVPQLFIAV